MFKHFGILLLIGLCAGCLFGPSRGPKVLGYHAGSVIMTNHQRYRVGAIPPGWREQKVGRRGMAFHEPTTGALMTTQAACGAAFEDAPLKGLMGSLTSGLAPDTVEPAQSLRLDGRGALRQSSYRVVDGVRVFIDAVVVKKNGCAFDFVLLAPPAQRQRVASLFETFVHGFHY
jgi:hypothetical protein